MNGPSGHRLIAAGLSVAVTLPVLQAAEPPCDLVLAQPAGPPVAIWASGRDSGTQRAADSWKRFLDERGCPVRMLADAPAGGAAGRDALLSLETAEACPAARRAGVDPAAIQDARPEAYILTAKVWEGRPIVSIVGRTGRGVDAGAAWLLSKVGWWDGRLTIAPISAVRHPFIRERIAHLGDAALLKSLRYAREDHERMCTIYWAEPRLAEYAAQIRACGFNAVEKGTCDYEVKRTEEKIRCYLDLSRGVHAQGMRMVAFLWGIQLSKGPTVTADLAKSIGRETDHAVTHWRDPGPGGYEQPMRMTAAVLAEFRKMNPQVQVTLSTWANNGFWKSIGDATFLGESLAPREIGIALHRWYNPAYAERVRKAGRHVGVWGWYLMDMEWLRPPHFRTRQLDRYFSSPLGNPEDPPDWRFWYGAAPEMSAALDWMSLELCFHALPSEINLYVGGQKMWDPRRPLGEITRDWCRAVFGPPNAEAMREAYDAVEVGRAPDQPAKLYKHRDDLLPEIVRTPEFGRRAEAALAALRGVRLPPGWRPNFPVMGTPQGHLDMLAAELQALIARNASPVKR